MSAEQILRDYLEHRPTDSAARRKLKSAVISVWAANKCPAVIEVLDDRYGDPRPCYFLFRLGTEGPEFETRLFLPQASELTCPEEFTRQCPYPTLYSPATSSGG